MATDNISKVVTLAVNDSEVHKKLQKIRGSLEETKKELDELRKKPVELLTDTEIKRIQTLTRELERSEGRIKKLNATSEEVNHTIQNLGKSTLRELQRSLKAMNKELNSGSIPRNSEQWRTLQANIGRTRQEIERVKQEQRDLAEGGSSLLRRLQENWLGVVGAVAGFNFAKNAISEYVEAFAEVDDVMTGVQKYTGMARAEVEQLAETFAQMDTRTTREQLLLLAQDAGRLGLSTQAEVKQFVEAADTINLALGEDLGEGAVKNIAKLAQIFGDSERLGLRGAMLATASTINELAQSSTASEPYLAEFASRLGSIGSTAGLTQAQILAFGSVMDQSGVNVDRAATALQNVIMKLYQDPAAAAQAAGLEVQAFTELMRTDANEAVLQWASAMGKLQGGLSDTAPVLKQLHMAGSGVSEMIMNLAKNTDLVRQTQQQATQAFNEATSATNEAATANSSAAATLEKLQDRLTVTRQEMGEKLMPIFVKLTEGAAGFMSTLNTLMSVAASPWFISIASAIGVLTVAMNAHIAVEKLQVLWNERVIASSKNLVAAIKEKAWAGWAAGITLVVGLMYSLYNEIWRVKSATELLNEAMRQGVNDTAAERAELKNLYEATQDQTRAMNDRLAAAEELRKRWPDVFDGLSTEAILAGNAASAYENLANSIVAAAQAEALRGKIAEIARENLKLQTELTELDHRRSLANSQGEEYMLGGEIMHTTGSNFGNLKYDGQINRLRGQIAENERTMQQLASRVSSLTAGSNRSSQSTQSTPSTPSTPRTPRTPSTPRAASSAPKQQEQTPYDTMIGVYQNQLAREGLDPVTRQGLQERLQNLEALKKFYLSEVGKRLREFAGRDTDVPLPTGEGVQGRSLSAAEWRERGKEGGADPWHELGLGASSSVSITQELAEALGLAGTAADTLQERIAPLYEQFQKGTLTQEAYNDELARLFLEVRRSEDLKKYEARIKAVNEAEAQGVLTHEQAVAALRRLKQERAQAVDALVSPTAANLQSDTATAVANIYTQLQARRTAFEEIKRLEEEQVITHEEAERKRAEASKQYTDNILAAAGMMYTQLNSLVNGYSNYMKAQRDAEIEQVERRYDAELSKYNSNSKKYKAIEEKKNREVAAIKTKYNKRAQGIELAQAFASTALAAINAYASASKMNWLLGPIAAALATAAGMMQIATIRKQHEAESSGYAEGGFTPKGSKYKEVGTVHAGEFVATQEAVNNPHLSELFHNLDYAQKAGIVANIRPSDLVTTDSGAVVMGRSERSFQSTQSTQNTQTAQSLAIATALERLNDRLEAGTLAQVVLSGDNGLHRQYTKYKKLIK